jgi:hypothetical protein
MKITVKKFLCADALVTSIYHLFREVPDPRKTSIANSIPFVDVLMSGLAVFSLKFPSLLQYDSQRKLYKHNLKALYHVNEAPSDTYLRERLDELDPSFVRPAFKKPFAALQRANYLEQFEYLDGHYLLSLDGTGKLSSDKVYCPYCCKKEHSNGVVTYYHQMLGACIVHPEKSNVIPLCPEMIQNEDGAEKNDCERNATKRFIENFKREHPHLKVIVVGDGITSNAPYIQLLEENKIKYILGAKPGDHKFLFEYLNASTEAQYYELKDDKGIFHQFRYLNNVPLNKSNPEVRVNVIEYMQTDKNGKETKFSWVTNIQITQHNIFKLMRGGRARWKIENETFNTLKNYGYNFEHNYGHGKKHLSTILSLLMMIAFLIDQVQEIACNLFQTIRKLRGSYQSLWETIRVLFQFVPLSSWEELFQLINKRPFTPNSS